VAPLSGGEAVVVEAHQGDDFADIGLLANSAGGELRLCRETPDGRRPVAVPSVRLPPSWGMRSARRSHRGDGRVPGPLL
jgi:hypothetical protein